MQDGESAAAPDDARLLDLELDAIFGKGFSRVVEHHFRDIAGEGLWRALVADPEGARETMGTILGSGRAADLVFRALKDRLMAVEGMGRPERQISTSISR
ncbi:MAG: hypothetical protein JRN11_04640 [Nitrososphaerota archaeon]|nr:hypothetical protein [Nitrososphaerota archaeon]MDG7012736.1 hypothetical protein [Nitrososphaerota archaeon]MDG7026014.1 hypothetical protein [Nitrososphaerota archaeon]